MFCIPHQHGLLRLTDSNAPHTCKMLFGFVRDVLCIRKSKTWPGPLFSPPFAPDRLQAAGETMCIGLLCVRRWLLRPGGPKVGRRRTTWDRFRRGPREVGGWGGEGSQAGPRFSLPSVFVAPTCGKIGCRFLYRPFVLDLILHRPLRRDWSPGSGFASLGYWASSRTEKPSLDDQKTYPTLWPAGDRRGGRWG